jgi:chaperonin GroES
MTNIKPIGNRIVVQLTKKKNISTSGIILTTEQKNEQAIGEVLAIGGGQGIDENVKDLGLKVGDKVLFGKYSGEEIQDDSDSETLYKILNGKDVLAIIN